MKTLQCDVAVVGGGPAGTFAAVKAAENGARVILLDKGYVGKSGCGTFGAGFLQGLAQGGGLPRSVVRQGGGGRLFSSTIRTG